MFLVTILVMNLADKRQKLENNVFQTAGIAQKYNCALRRLSYQQEQGFVSTLPLGVNHISYPARTAFFCSSIFILSISVSLRLMVLSVFLSCTRCSTRPGRGNFTFRGMRSGRRGFPVKILLRRTASPSTFDGLDRRALVYRLDMQRHHHAILQVKEIRQHTVSQFRR